MTAKDPRVSYDELGVPSFASEAVGNAYVNRYYDPFEELLRTPGNGLQGAPESLVDASVQVRDDLHVARAIAASIFGRGWQEHAFAVYDRLQASKASRKRAASPADEDE